MSDPLQSANGSSPSSGSGLVAAIERFQTALVKVNTDVVGNLQLNLMQLFLDQALSEVRIEALFEAIRDRVTEPPALTKIMCNLLHEKAQRLEALIKPQIAIASGRVPRNG
jgi:hypothetical protein